MDDYTLAGNTPSKCVVAELMVTLRKIPHDRRRTGYTIAGRGDCSEVWGEETASQHKYVLTILEKYNMQDSQPVATPETGRELSPEPEGAMNLDDEVDTIKEW